MYSHMCKSLRVVRQRFRWGKQRAASDKLASTFVGSGIWKLTTPAPKLGETMPRMEQISSRFLSFTAVADILGGFGILLPSVMRIKPELTVLAALGCTALMGGAITFHVSRGEAANTPFNFLLAALSLLVAWGRWSKAPISPRA